MIIIARYLIRNLLENKLRLLLVVFSIAISASLIFVNEGFSRTVETMIKKASQRWEGNAELIIETKKEFGANEWIEDVEFSNKSQIEYSVECTRMSMLYAPSIEKMKYLTVIGTDINEFNFHNPIILSSGTKKDFNGKKIIIGKEFAKQFNILLGDLIPLEFEGKIYSFKVVGLSKAEGLFRRDIADGGFGIIPKDFFDSMYGKKSNLIFVGLQDKVDVDSIYYKTKELFKGYKVTYTRDDTLLKSEINNYIMPFKVSTISVILMSFFIIYTVFQLLYLKRINTIGTFRSVGCTKKLLYKLLISESIFLGIISGFVGCIIGIGLLTIIKEVYFSGDISYASPTLVFGYKEIVITLIASVIITLCSSLVPLIKTTKIPIKNIMLNDLNKLDKKINKLWFLGTTLMILAFIIPFFLPKNLIGMIIASVLATVTLIGLLLVIPKVIDFFANLASYIPFIGHEITLGIKNVKDSSYLMNNIRLFASTIAIIGFMNSIFFTLSSDLTKAFESRSKFDVYINMMDKSEEVVSQLSNIEGVDSYTDILTKEGLNLIEQETFLNVLYGIDNNKCFDFLDADNKNAVQAIKQLGNGNNIVLTTILKSKFNLNIGDELILSDGAQETKYKITGFLDSTLNIGHIGFVSTNNLLNNYSDIDKFIYVKGNMEPNIVKNNIKREMIRKMVSIETKDELRKANSDKVDGIFDSINTYAYIAMVVGIIGIINNIITSYLIRKRSLAMYRCVGMSKKQLKDMLMSEAIFIGALGILLGIITVSLMAPTIPIIVSVFWGNVEIAHATEKYLMLSAIGIISMIAVSYIPAIKSKKLSIIESIKHE
jgi:putative ABC transport system permease protein